MIERLLPIIATMVARTLRLRWVSARPPARSVVMFWHGTMVAGWWVARQARPVALVSQSKDGELLAGVLRRWNYHLVRGSSHKHGMEALEQALDEVAAHAADSVAITPDGPRGPRQRFKRGAFIAAQRLDCPLYFLRVQYDRAVTLRKSWDRFCIPLPFSRVTLEAIEVEVSDFPIEREAQRVWLDALALRLAGGEAELMDVA